MRKRVNVLAQRPTRFFEEDWSPLFNWSNNSFSTTATLPSVNIKESEKQYTVEVAAPGLQKDHFQISVEKDVLTISAEVKEEKNEKANERYTKKEFSYQSFSRSFNLNNEKIDDENIQASYKDGVLLISIPKREIAIDTKRTIEISE